MYLRTLILFVFILVGLVLTFKKPIWGIFTYIILCYVNPYYYWWGEPLLPFRIYLLISFATLLSIIAKDIKLILNLKKTNISILLIMFLGSMLASWLFNEHNNIDFDLWVGRYFKYVVLYGIILCAIQDIYDYEKLLWANIIGGLYLGVDAYLGGGYYYKGRLEGFGGTGWEESGGLSIYVCIVLPFLLDRFFLSSQRIMLNRIVVATTGAFCLRLLIETKTRAAFLAMICMGIIFVLKLKSFKNKAGYIALSIVGVCGILYLADDIFWTRMGSIHSAYESIEDRSSREGSFDRYDIWILAFEAFKENPLLGIGPGNFRSFAGNYFRGKDSGQVTAAHNMFLLIAAENGSIGILIIVSIIYCSLKILRQIRKKTGFKYEIHIKQSSIFLEMSFIGFLVNGIFYNSIYLEGFFWLVSMIGSLYLLTEQSKYDSEKID